MNTLNKVQQGLKRYFSELLFIMIIAGVAIIFTFNFSVLYVSGESMQPTYADGDVVILKNKKVLEKDDIVVFSLPESWGEGGYNLVKRVFAVEGDNLKLEYPTATINGQVRDFSEKECYTTKKQEFTLKEGEFFVVGDNTANSNDSYFQYCIGLDDYAIKKELIKTYGTEVFRIGGFR